MEPMTTYHIVFKNREAIMVPLPDSEATEIINYITTHSPVEKRNEESCCPSCDSKRKLKHKDGIDHIKLGHHLGTINVSEVLYILPLLKEITDVNS